VDIEPVSNRVTIFTSSSKMVIKSFRALLGYLFVVPFAFLTYGLMPFLGRQRAIGRVGKLLTKTTVFCLGLLVPDISSPSEFAVFQKRIKRNFMFLSPLYDLKIARHTENGIEFNVHHCFVTSALKKAGLSDMCHYACAADWVVAKKNKECWEFSRQHTIGTGGPFCNHTYMRKNT
jgi:hypothetical protein